jgi:hypothetical protein
MRKQAVYPAWAPFVAAPRHCRNFYFAAGGQKSGHPALTGPRQLLHRTDPRLRQVGKLA